MIAAALVHRVIDRLRGGDVALDAGVDVAWLSGGEGEGVARVGYDGEAYALKLTALDASAIRTMQRECGATRWAADRALAPALVLALPERGALLTRCVPGEPLAREALRDGECRDRVAATLRRIHAGPAMPYELTLRADLDDELALAKGSLATEMFTALDAAARAAWEALARRPARLVPCHGDFHPGNVFDLGDRVVAIDWAAAGMGDGAWDVAMLACSAELDETAWHDWLKSCYGDPSHEQRERADAMALLADAYCLAWYANYPMYEPDAVARFERRVRARLA